MSSPTKQVSGRRLPPLPNHNPGGRLIIRSPKTTTEVEEREALMSNVEISNTSGTSSQDIKSTFIIETDIA